MRGLLERLNGLAGMAAQRSDVIVMTFMLLAVVMIVLVAVCFFVKGGRDTLMICVDSLAEGARNALPVGIACAIVGRSSGEQITTSPRPRRPSASTSRRAAAASAVVATPRRATRTTAVGRAASCRRRPT